MWPLFTSLCIAFCAVQVAYAAFGFIASGSDIVVDTNAGLVFTVNSSNGDIISMKFNNKEASQKCLAILIRSD